MKEVKELAKQIIEIVGNKSVKEMEALKDESNGIFRLYSVAKEFVAPKPTYRLEDCCEVSTNSLRGLKRKIEKELNMAKCSKGSCKKTKTKKK